MDCNNILEPCKIGSCITTMKGKSSDSTSSTETFF